MWFMDKLSFHTKKKRKEKKRKEEEEEEEEEGEDKSSAWLRVLDFGRYLTVTCVIDFSTFLFYWNDNQKSWFSGACALNKLIILNKSN